MASTSRQEKLAKLYDADIVPIWSDKFGKLLIRNITIPEKGMLLDIGCGTGYPALEILKKAVGSIRIIAIDKSSAMLDIARKKAGDKSGKTIFFRTENASENLSFADEVYDITYSNLGFMELGGTEKNIKELMRVTAPGGQVAITLPISKSWSEFFDIFKDVLTKRGKYDVFKDIDAYKSKALPTSEETIKLMEDAGLKDIKFESEHFELLFKSAREFFFAPVVEYGPLKEWKSIIKDPEEMKNIFVDIKDAIDTMFSGLIFPVSINAGCFIGTKPSEEEFELIDDDDIELVMEED